MPEQPSLPRVGVGAVLVRDGAALLVQRARPPAQGQWAIPGGKVHPGEPLQAAAERELLEETGVRARAGAPVHVFDLIERDAAGHCTRHYVIVDLEVEYLSGEPRAGDDAAAVRWVGAEQLEGLDVHPETLHLLRTRYGF